MNSSQIVNPTRIQVKPKSRNSKPQATQENPIEATQEFSSRKWKNNESLLYYN